MPALRAQGPPLRRRGHGTPAGNHCGARVRRSAVPLMNGRRCLGSRVCARRICAGGAAADHRDYGLGVGNYSRSVIARRSDDRDGAGLEFDRSGNVAAGGNEQAPVAHRRQIGDCPGSRVAATTTAPVCAQAPVPSNAFRIPSIKSGGSISCRSVTIRRRQPPARATAKPAGAAPGRPRAVVSCGSNQCNRNPNLSAPPTEQQSRDHKGITDENATRTVPR